MVVIVNGVSLHYDITGEGAPLLWLHGFTGAGADWRHIFPAPPIGYQVIAPDLRGHGASSNPSAHFTFRDCARDIAALLAHLGVPRVKAIGLSGGGDGFGWKQLIAAIVGLVILLSGVAWFLRPILGEEPDDPLE